MRINDHTAFRITMATNKIYYDAIPAPLRIASKRPDPKVRPQAQVLKCNNLARLPPQPIFDTSNVFENDICPISKACQCLKSPSSPLSSPVFPRSSSMLRNGSESRDFSALFMKSPTLRRELECCQCQQTTMPRTVSVQSFPQDDRAEASSIESGYSSTYSR